MPERQPLCAISNRKRIGGLDARTGTATTPRRFRLWNTHIEIWLLQVHRRSHHDYNYIKVSGLSLQYDIENYRYRGPLFRFLVHLRSI
jgi:hypothetical protein